MRACVRVCVRNQKKKLVVPGTVAPLGATGPGNSIFFSRGSSNRESEGLYCWVFFHIQRSLNTKKKNAVAETIALQSESSTRVSILYLLIVI